MRNAMLAAIAATSLLGGHALAQSPAKHCYAIATGGDTGPASVLFEFKAATVHIYWQQSTDGYEKMKAGKPFSEVARGMNDWKEHPVTTQGGVMTFVNGNDPHHKNYATYTMSIVGDAITGKNDGKHSERKMAGSCT